MSIDTDLRDTLANHAGLSALVGSRIYPVITPEKPTVPAVSYDRISTTRQQAVSRNVASASVRFQIIAWSERAEETESVAAQIRDALLNMTGSTVTIYEIQLAGEREDYEDDAQLYRRDVDVLILHSE